MLSRSAVSGAAFLRFFLPALCLFAQPALAMTFHEEWVHERLLLHFDGEIEDGDRDKMMAFLQGLKTRYGAALQNAKPIVFLNSPGGDVVEAAKIGELIHKSGQAVAVEAHHRCASSCFLLFAAGHLKQIGRGAYIGVHSSSIKGKETSDSYAVSVWMSRYLNSIRRAAQRHRQAGHDRAE